MEFGAILAGERGAVVLVAHLLSLLVAFIGEALTLQLLVEIWPPLLAHTSSFSTGDPM